MLNDYKSISIDCSTFHTLIPFKEVSIVFEYLSHHAPLFSFN